MIDCHRLDLSASDDSDLAVLDHAEQARAGRFRFAHHSSRYIAAHAQARRLLGARLDIAPARVPLATTRYGKPILAEAAAAMAGPAARERFFWFNLTHCDAVGYLAIAPFSVGVDVERLRSFADLQPLIASCCSTAEIAALAAMDPETRAAGFLRIWTRKEAALKAWGTGIGAVALNELHVGAETDWLPPLKGSLVYPALRLRTLVLENECLSVAAATEQPLEIRLGAG
jgi:4'-phosphopantetheinyl transferase